MTLGIPITGRTDRQTDRVRRNMRPPPREEGRIIKIPASKSKHTAYSKLLHLTCILQCSSDFFKVFFTRATLCITRTLPSCGVCLSVRPSVRLSHTSIVSKRLKLS